jgi:hypothetical protein
MVVAAMFPVPTVDKTLDELGVAIDKMATDKRAAYFAGEIIWYITARQKMDS